MKGKFLTIKKTDKTNKFIRRFIFRVLPRGFHRIRHYGLISNTRRKGNLTKARDLLKVPEPSSEEANDIVKIYGCYFCPIRLWFTYDHL